MTQEAYQTIMAHLAAVAGCCGGVITREEIEQVVLKLEPHISVWKLEELIRDCKTKMSVVPRKTKEEIHERLFPTPPPPPPPPLNDSLMDHMLRLQLREKTDPAIRREWMTRVEADPDLQPVMALMPTEDANTIAQKLALTKEELFLRQQKIFNLYYDAVYSHRRRQKMNV